MILNKFRRARLGSVLSYLEENYAGRYEVTDAQERKEYLSWRELLMPPICFILRTQTTDTYHQKYLVKISLNVVNFGHKWLCVKEFDVFDLVPPEMRGEWWSVDKLGYLLKSGRLIKNR